MIKKLLIILVCALTFYSVDAQTDNSKKISKLEKKLNNYFGTYKIQDNVSKMLSYTLDDNEKKLTITADEIFAKQEFTWRTVEKIYRKINKALPSPYDEYQLCVMTKGKPIEELIGQSVNQRDITENPPKHPDVSNQTVSTIIQPPVTTSGNTWGDIEYKGKPWIQNMSKPGNITQGLQNRHMTIWASHGRYYDQQKSTWKWQRPNLFGTTEDLFTQTIVVPYLIPMLENAGAVVFTPRERDWQKNEIIIDNDDAVLAPFYIESGGGKKWSDTGLLGFAQHSGQYSDGENPFGKGSARMVATTSGKKNYSQIQYQPKFTKTGRYAVYVSYQTLPNSIDDAEYIVYHQGQKTVFHVNQQMGGGTWVYLGTFEFDAGCNSYNCVVVTNNSQESGVVTTDAVRFGGGMGNIVRGGTTSGLPRCLEGSRYYAQWAGAPREVVSASNGTNDYTDDINVRSLMSNWLAGGSCYVPAADGKHVPIELSLAVHSDAGVSKTDDIYGTLSICTTNNENRTIFNSGLDRNASHDFAELLLDGVYKDLSAKYGNWTRRSLWDRNYSETRRPEVPSAILETMSHQNFADMRYGLDPNFRFTLARSIYKTILRYIANQHGCHYTVQPLQPTHFRIELSGRDKAVLKWTGVSDPQEPTAKPTGYNVYMAAGTGGFDNGTHTGNTTYSVDLEPGVLYRFRVTACNRGGESFPTEELSVCCQPNAKATVLVVNGFHRLSSPAVINNDTQQGFDLNNDPGVTYGKMAGWAGYQLCYDKAQSGKEGPGALGYCGNELAGTIIAGNEFNYTTTHAEAIHTAQKYNIVSCSSEAIETNQVNLKNYHCVDLILGLEKNDGHALCYYKTFTPQMRQKLTEYLHHKGRLMVSGSYIGADMTATEEQSFLADMLKVNYGGSDRNNDGNNVNGLGLNFNIYRTLNEDHYAATAPDIVQPLSSAICAMTYSDGREAAVAYSGTDYKTFTLGFPFECITDAKMRAAIMRGIMAYLLK